MKSLTYRKAALPKSSTTGGGPSTLDEGTRSVEVIAATEAEVEIYDYEHGHVREVLLMSGLEMPASGQLPLLESHSRYSTSSVVGSVRQLKISGGQLVGRAYFTEAPEGQAVWQRVKEGHLTDFSAGYRALESVFIPENQTIKVGKRSFTGPMLVTKRWKIKELSAVAIGADENSKARSNTMTIEHIENTEETHQRPRTLRREAERNARAEVKEILSLGDSHNFQEAATDAVREGWTSEQFRQYILDKMRSRGRQPVQTGVADLGLSGREINQFSFLKAIRHLADPGNKRLYEEAAFERECSEALQKQTRRDSRGIMVPTEVLRHDVTRGMSTGTLAGGGALVAENLQTGSFIDSLENAMVCKALGAIMLRDLVGDAAIPKKTGGATAYWIGEDDDITAESAPALGQVVLKPHTVGDYTDLSRRLIVQSSIDVEQFVRNELALSLALAIDLAGLAGPGANGQPLGILNTTGIGTKTLATANTPTHGEICDIWGEVATDNALVGNLGYTANATIAGKMMQTDVGTDTGKFVLSDTGRTSNGYPFLMSNQVTSKYILFGNWRDLIIGEWSGVDINVDTASLSKSGGVRVVALQDVDVALRHPESFAYGYKA